MPRIPEGVMLSLHQDFWRHRRACARCNSKTGEESFEFQNTTCCLENWIKNRDVVKRATRKSPAQQDDGDNESDEKPAKTPKKSVKKELTLEEAQAKWQKNHDEQLEMGKIWRTYAIDDDFDAGGQTGQTRDVYFADHSAKHYDIAVTIEEDDSIFEDILVSVKLS
jgi:hypothetical protein